MIKHVAVKIGECIYALPRPNRHRDIHDSILVFPKQGGSVVGSIDGFLDADGNFMTREQGLEYALSVSQIKAPQWEEDRLFSEDLW